MTPEVESEIEKQIFTYPTIKKEWKDSEIREVKTTTSELVTKYQVEIVNPNGETADIELVQQG